MVGRLGAMRDFATEYRLGCDAAGIAPVADGRIIKYHVGVYGTSTIEAMILRYCLVADTLAPLSGMLSSGPTGRWDYDLEIEARTREFVAFCEGNGIVWRREDFIARQARHIFPAGSIKWETYWKMTVIRCAQDQHAAFLMMRFDWLR